MKALIPTLLVFAMVFGTTMGCSTPSASKDASASTQDPSCEVSEDGAED
jgi:hypothetical protein